MNLSRLSFSLLTIVTILISTNLFAQQIDMKLFEDMKPRAIGPAGMSGRVTTIDVVTNDPEIIYVGTASGGLWRSTNAGISWTPLFDEQPAAAIGAVAIDQNVPDIIWVGTGEGNPRNSQSSGNGIYKSIDGGKSWKFLGLEKSRNIHRIIIDPGNSDVVYVGSQGSAWGEGEQRGVFKTIDGGKSWQKVLYVNEKTGIADLVIDPSNPNKLVAAMWEYRRWPWYFESGGKGSGLYVTFDGGNNWEKRTEKDGLPSGNLGRIGLAIAPSNPKIIYALIEAKKNGFYKSTDGGFNWKKTTDKNIGGRPFYYADIYVDPQNENRIYNISSEVDLSIDGGETFSKLVPWWERSTGDNYVHPDHHALWIHPDDPNYIINGNDGGLNISHDRGNTWRFVNNLPLAQFYHINVDMEWPYNIYGGMQDNGSWRGPNRVLRRGGIRNSYWEELSFGDGFDVVPKPDNSRFGYSMSQGGSLYRYDFITGNLQDIQPYHPEDKPLRFHWNAGIAQDPFNNESIFYGSQYLHKSNDMGNSWKIISPDLTTNDSTKQKQLESGGLTYDVTDAENHTTILSIAPSPLKEGIIWVGTDDGNVQLTKDGGKSWTNLIANINDAPKNGWVAQIQASTYNEAEAFVVINNYRQDDWTPYLFYTSDFGKSWRNLANSKQLDGYTLSFVQDFEVPELMFLGTEFGLYISLDAGKNWTKWTQGFPTVSTMDMIIHPRENDLVIGTFGRAAYVLDDITPLRNMARNSKSIFEAKAKLFQIPDSYITLWRQPNGARFVADGEFKGQNKSDGTMITYYLNPDTTKVKKDEMKESSDKQDEDLKTEEKKKENKVVFEVFDSNGEKIRTFKREPKKGINRFFWGQEMAGFRFPTQSKPKKDADEPGGMTVLPGEYLIKMSYDGIVDSSSAIINYDPRVEVNLADMKARLMLVDSFKVIIEPFTEVMDNIRDAENSLEIIAKLTKEKDEFDDLEKKGKEISKKIKELLEIVNQKDVQGIRRDPTRLGSRISNAYYTIAGSDEAPGEKEQLRLKHLKKYIGDALLKMNSFLDSEWKEYKTDVQNSGLTFFN